MSLLYYLYMPNITENIKIMHTFLSLFTNINNIPVQNKPIHNW